ncbi:hypothetical protein GWI33_017243 [Rhynchophorus ferrugineus]|uniref:Uncharacterized protein n=1 Tax=Rhynchophorus ferrugineus TaxID=354439 RepID=A0A834I2D7_RHYFE|nr:hypothetical protein GWI33_017243 [Rhynchophorus ferrugineus]
MILRCSKFHTLQKLTYVQKVQIWDPLQKRTFTSLFRKVPITALRSIDKIPKNYELMYRNDMDRFIQVTQAMLFVGSTISLISIIFNANNYVGPLYQSEETIGKSKTDIPLKERQRTFCFVVCAMVLVVSVLQMYAARLPVRIYYNPQNRDYIACLYGVIPNTIKKQRIKIGEIKPLTKIPFWSLYGDVTYKHDNGRKFILFENYFRRISDLYIMLGIQEDVRAKGYVKPDDDD